MSVLWRPENQAKPLRDDAVERVRRDECPTIGCDGPLDTGWECNRCGFDAYLIAQTEGVTRQ